MTKTTLPKLQTKSEKQWYLIDAKGQTLGHLATKVVDLLRGKNKVIFTHHVDVGAYVVVINMSEIHVTGKKELDKDYFHHTRYPNGLHREVLGDLRKTNPAKILQDAVSGMLPRNRSRRFVMERLKIYAGEQHEHIAQKPESVTL
ncbi:50S ribosomal protein L13 [Candidatus Peregrinibacteria bacterium]|nr:50S ribosomal protein L13 [Candidatus Peregrinibacteria bacterium]